MYVELTAQCLAASDQQAFVLVGIAPNPEATASSSSSCSSTAAASALESGVGGKEGSRDGGQRAGHGDVGQVQGPLQLSSTATAWKEALGEVDVGKWDLIYRQGPVYCLSNALCDALCIAVCNTVSTALCSCLYPVQCPMQCPVQYPVQCTMRAPGHCPVQCSVQRLCILLLGLCLCSL